MYAPTPLYLKMKAKSAEQQKLEAEVVTLRQRLEEKDQTETFIESKHSKLAEVYQALETACQADLRSCKSSVEKLKEAGAVEDDGRMLTRLLRGVRYLKFVGVFLAGLLLGNQLQRGLLVRLVRVAISRITRRHLDESHSLHMHGVGIEPRSPRGWMPTTVGATLEDMKLS
mmetsp:Transcript_51729/g.116147  ORF Transcript_51729/g.116147 Transcript_51729/m.116147 type:complete len:171 (-) Transcript_51729:279-791(-)